MSFSLNLISLQKQMAKRRIAVLKSLGLICTPSAPPSMAVVERILPPRHYHINWPATRQYQQSVRWIQSNRPLALAANNGPPI